MLRGQQWWSCHCSSPPGLQLTSSLYFHNRRLFLLPPPGYKRYYSSLFVLQPKRMCVMLYAHRAYTVDQSIHFIFLLRRSLCTSTLLETTILTNHFPYTTPHIPPVAQSALHDLSLSGPHHSVRVQGCLDQIPEI